MDEFEKSGVVSLAALTLAIPAVGQNSKIHAPQSKEVKTQTVEIQKQPADTITPPSKSSSHSKISGSGQGLFANENLGFFPDPNFPGTKAMDPSSQNSIEWSYHNGQGATSIPDIRIKLNGKVIDAMYRGFVEDKWPGAGSYFQTGMNKGAQFYKFDGKNYAPVNAPAEHRLNDEFGMHLGWVYNPNDKPTGFTRANTASNNFENEKPVVSEQTSFLDAVVTQMVGKSGSFILTFNNGSQKIPVTWPLKSDPSADEISGFLNSQQKFFVRQPKKGVNQWELYGVVDGNPGAKGPIKGALEELGTFSKEVILQQFPTEFANFEFGASTTPTR